MDSGRREPAEAVLACHRRCTVALSQCRWGWAARMKRKRKWTRSQGSMTGPNTVSSYIVLSMTSLSKVLVDILTN